MVERVRMGMRMEEMAVRVAEDEDNYKRSWAVHVFSILVFVLLHVEDAQSWPTATVPQYWEIAEQSSLHYNFCSDDTITPEIHTGGAPLRRNGPCRSDAILVFIDGVLETKCSPFIPT